jgi:hypothetical protein
MKIRKTHKHLHKPNKPDKGIYYGYAARPGKVDSILIHSTNGAGDSSFESEVNFLLNSPAVTSEYEVGAEEIVEHLPPKEYYGFHAGNVRNQKFSNSRSIGIEVHYSPRDTKSIDPRRIYNLTELVEYLLAEYDLTPDDISLHRWEAIPKGRKVDPSFWTDAQFLEWRNTLSKNEKFTILQEAFIYTTPTFETVAKHITSGPVVNGLLPVGHEFEGQWVHNNSAIWLSTGWGFVKPYVIDGHTILNGLQVDPIRLHRALNLWAKHLSLDERESIVSAFTTYGELTTIGNLYAFTQAAKETGWFASERWVKSYNPAGLGADDTGAWGQHFNNPAEGILAQYAHLLCYAVPDDKLSAIQQKIARLSPRREALIGAYGLGAANNTWVGLNQKWNSPLGNAPYAQEIIALAERVMKL